MRNDKLSDLSMKLSVDVINLTKQLRVVNTKLLSLIKSPEAPPAYALTSQKANMDIAEQILSQNSKLL